MNTTKRETKMAGKRGWARTILAPVVFFLLGAAASAVWFSNGHAPAPSDNIMEPPPAQPEAVAAPQDDLAEALSRAKAATAKSNAAPRPTTPADAATIAAVRRAIPDLATVSLEDATRRLRNAALTQFAQAANEMESQVREAREQFLKAQTNQSEAGQQAAVARLQKLQTDSAARLKQISLEAHNQIAALQQLKSASP